MEDLQVNLLLHLEELVVVLVEEVDIILEEQEQTEYMIQHGLKEKYMQMVKIQV